MQILNVNSKLWWLVKADEIRASAGTPVVDAVKKVVETFAFVQVPTGLPGPNDGFHFQEGRFVHGDQITAVKEIVIFNDGLSIEVYSDTETNLALLSKFVELLQSLGARKPITPPVVILQSMIVVEFPSSIDKLAAHYNDISRMLSKEIGVPGQQQLRVVEFSIDPDTLPKELANFNPTVFRLERRQNEEYDKNRFYSFANTHTENHIHILEKIGSLITN
jgi:hypothetical protein